nr:retrotransposon protein, putative, unclassified [Tanacetum cinerariifolium]
MTKFLAIETMYLNLLHYLTAYSLPSPNNSHCHLIPKQTSRIFILVSRRSIHILVFGVRGSSEVVVEADSDGGVIGLAISLPLYLTELSAEQAFWSQNSRNSEESNLFSSTTILEVPKELPKVSMVNSSLKKLKFHLASFDMVVKERTTVTAITEDIVNIVMHANVNYACNTVNECERCVTIETELQRDFIKRECFDTLFKKNNSFSQQSALTFDQLFEINDLRAQSQEKDMFIMKLKEIIKSLSGNVQEEKIKRELEKIETINIELDHRVTKLVAKNKHLKQTYNQLYDSIKSSCVRSKEQCDDLIKQVNIKSAENSYLNASLHEKVLVITALKETLSKLKGKVIVNEAVTLHPIDPELLKIDVAPLAPKLSNNRTAHNDYLKNTQEETATLREIVENERLLNPLNTSLDYTLPLKKPIPIESNTSKPVVTLVVQIVLWYLDSKCSKHMTGDRSQLINFIQKFQGKVKFENDHVANIMGYGDYKIGNVMISRVYFVEGLGHNLFSVGQFCDSNLEVSFHQHTCFILNLDGVDLLIGSRGNNLYTLSLKDMMASSPICLLSNALKSKSWLWHRHLSHLNFGAINHLARQGLVRAPDFIIKFLKMIQVGISHKTSVARSPQQNGVVERHYRMIFEAARTIKTPYELLHNKLPDLSFLHVFGALCYPTNDSENLGKLQPKVDIGIFIGYPLTKKAFWIYNRCIRRIVETFHVDFNELTAMASEQSSSGPALNKMTPATINSGLMQKPSSSMLYVPPSRNDWDLLFQPMFKELLNPPPSVDHQAPEVIALIADVIPPIQAELTGSSSSTSVDQDAPSPSKSQTTPETQSSIIPQDVEEDINDIEVAHMGNDPLFGVPILEVTSAKSSSTIEAMQEELNEFERIEVWELVPRLDRVMVITLKWIYKVRLEELGGILKSKARLVAHDDIIFAASTPELCDLFANLMCSKFKMSIMGKISFFLGLQISQSPKGIFINQSKYALESLKKYGFESCDPVDTPMVKKFKLDEDKEGKAIDPSHYCAFIDADHDGCQDTRRSTSGSLLWPCIQQNSMYCDNKSAIALCCNNVQHSRSKHIDIRYHFIKEQVENGVIELYFVNTEYQLADLFTKALGRDRIEFLINKLGMRSFTPETLKQLTDEVNE